MARFCYMTFFLIFNALIVQSWCSTDQQFQIRSQEVLDFTSLINKQEDAIHKLEDSYKLLTRTLIRMQNENNLLKDTVQTMLNKSLEERVAVLEIQVIDIREDIVEIEEDTTDLNGDVNFLFDEQVIQDERLFELEEETENLQINAVELDARVSDLEENGGGGNDDLEERVTTLEETSGSHESRLIATEQSINELNSINEDLEERVTILEENGGSTSNDTLAFHAVLTEFTSANEGSTLEFNEVLVNLGDGYDASTGIFTVPSAGVYYFTTYVTVDLGEFALMEIRVNDVAVCCGYGDHTSNDGDASSASCSAVVSVAEGDKVKVIYVSGSDSTPVYSIISNYYNGFLGYKL